MKSLIMVCILGLAASAAAELRPPAVAGAFYPGESEALRAAVDTMLEAAAGARSEGGARALIVPHAGYAYSGPTAAKAFARLSGEDVRRVIVLGPSHHFAFSGGALPKESVTGFETPLGVMPIDRKAVARLRRSSLFDGPAEAHVKEHSLEVELPFLQAVAPKAALVPVVLGPNTDLATCRAMAEHLAGLLDETTVVVASSDFTHHGDRYGWSPYAEEGLGKTLIRVARETAERAAELDARGFVKQVEVSGDTVCGVRPVGVLVALLERAFQGTGDLLEVTTSGHVSGSFDLSVSYVAAAFEGAWTSWSERPAPTTADELGREDGIALIELARATLSGSLTHDTEVARWFAAHPDRRRWEGLAGAFVTLNNTGKKARTEGRLRACMGVVEATEPLVDAVVQAAVWAAQDPRFPPLELEELDAVEIEVSVLSPMRPVRSHRFIQVGTHGVLMTKHGRRALYLPQVAVEQGWNLEAMLDNLSLKAGLPRTAWQSGATFEVFTSQVFSEGP
ncbi:MAG: AmmeMemoRadiSam system protein B [Thermoanaerobaculales bacterium]|jgi:AmmeMemoRadiSam system protein B/AmmeMemoRadiSam system protein A|nr:AmmeMemoRadiSam system protein B [Thermoanaerobaculales bacterium]